MFPFFDRNPPTPPPDDDRIYLNAGVDLEAEMTAFIASGFTKFRGYLGAYADWADFQRERGDTP